MQQVSRRGLVGVGLLLALALLVLSWAPATRHVKAVRFLERLGERSRPDAADRSAGIATEEVAIPGENGTIRGRLYYRKGATEGAGIVVAHGVHYRGIDESRLVPFARTLAESGYTVLTPELADVADYRITASGVSVIRDAVSYLVSRRDHVSHPCVGLLGFSFAGGLALVAARDRATSQLLTFVTSVGGHHDLGRVMRFLVHDEIQTPAGMLRTKAHEYGLVVLVYGNLERFVPEQDLPALRATFKAWLQEKRDVARLEADTLTTPEAEELWEMLETQNLRLLASELDALLAESEQGLGALSSAGRLRELTVPVYLLHGSHDSVIPPSETDTAALELAGDEHLALVSPLLEHVEVSKTAGIADKWALVTFMARLM